MKKWTKNRKVQVVNILTEEFKKSKINIFSSFLNLKVSEMQKLREMISQQDGKMMVVKNNLVNIVFQNLNKNEVCKFLNGPVFIVWSDKEKEVEIIKSLLNFQKDTGKIEIKGGILNGEIIDRDKINEIGRLPGKKELQMQLIFTMRMPVIRTINALRGPVSKLVNILNQIKTKKES